MNLEAFRKSLKEEIVGKEFVYKSKYGGETFGRVSKLTIQSVISCDEERGIRINNRVSELTTKVKKTDRVANSTRSWIGTSFEIIIFSENNIPYNLSKDEIYFIENGDEIDI